MARTNGAKTESSDKKEVLTEPEADVVAVATASESTAEPAVDPQSNAVDPQGIDDVLNSLKTLLSAVEKLQKVRQEVGDIKPLILRMLDGELIAGEELEQLKIGVGGLTRLVRAYGDHQAALTKAQPARSLLDDVLSVRHST